MSSPLTIAIATTYGFRPQRRDELDAEYQAAVAAYVEERDWSAAHEVRLQKPQAEWSAADREGFVDRLKRQPMPSMEFGRGVHAFPMIATPFRGEATWQLLVELAARGLEAVTERRTREPAWSCPVLISALTLDHRLLTTGTSPPQRLALLKSLIRREPIFGYVVVVDTFLHSVSPGGALKQDAFVVHLGSRVGSREMWVARYAVADGIVTFEPRRVIDLRTEAGPDTQDPYAELFVSVPPSSEVS